MQPRFSARRLGPLSGVACLLLVVACGDGTTRSFVSGSPDGGSPTISRPDDAPEEFGADDFWETDPPPAWCGPGKAPKDQVPGGTPECPSDKNKEGCPCTTLGEEAPCWPGLRKQRGLGVCKDGVTRCEADGEIGKVWGACKGAVKPRAGAKSGKDACACFSKGRWDIDNVVPCFVEIAPGKFAAVSTEAGNCPASLSSLSPGQMPKAPTGGTWSKDRLSADCAGHFKLCYAIKAGDVNAPSPNDCVVAKSCVDTDYKAANVTQALPDLPHWATTDSVCATKFQASGGYAEMSVIGESVRCDEVSDEGKPLVFRRNGFCPSVCDQDPSRPECQACAKDASGEF